LLLLLLLLSLLLLLLLLLLCVQFNVPYINTFEVQSEAYTYLCSTPHVHKKPFKR
jgi:hypothetical protein